MDLQYKDGKLIVDDFALDPGLPLHAVIRIGDALHMIPLAGWRSDPLKKNDLHAYMKRLQPDWQRPSPWVWAAEGLIPRKGYPNVMVGRAMTPEEFDAFCTQHNLSDDDDVSDPFDYQVGAIYGADAARTVKVRQVAISHAIQEERALADKGIFASCGSPGRLNIRVG